ncbi:MAG: hypothetical protein NVS3B20_15030 [Polyangiales bacterium]
MKSKILPRKTSDWSATVTYGSRILTLVLTGTADVKALTPLSEVIEELQEEAVSFRVQEVVVDIRALEFMSSACFKIFVTWLSQLQQSDAQRQYIVRFLSDSNRYWQRRSLSALSCFAVSLVKIDG